jgi:hypothetical protein
LGQLKVLNKVGRMSLVHDYFYFGASDYFFGPSEIIMSLMSFASGIYFLVVSKSAFGSTILSILFLISFIDGPAYFYSSV